MASKFRTAFNRTDFGNSKVFNGVTCVKKSLACDCDINVLFNKYCRGEQLPVSSRAYGYLDTTVSPKSFIDAKKIVEDCQSLFDSMPSEVRNEYGNKVEDFISALYNKEELLYRYGILSKNTDTVVNDSVSTVDVPNVIDTAVTQTSDLSVTGES